MDIQLKQYLEQEVFRGEIIDTKRGRGGLIFIVKQEGSDNKVAFKTVQEFESQRLENIERFNREAKNWFSISSHPLIITPFYIEKVNGFPLICMPYCDGDLRELIDSRPSLVGTVFFSIQIIKALLSAKARGMKNHQDIKPENILYQDLTKKFKGIMEPNEDDALKYVVRLADFGVVNAWDDGHKGGTNCYKAPEQYIGNSVDNFEPDIFAVGVIMAELYQGHHPAAESPDTNVQKWRGSKLKKWAIGGPHYLSIPQCTNAHLLVQLIREMLNNNPSERPSLEDCKKRLFEILTHLSPWATERLELTLEYFDYIDTYQETASQVQQLLKLAAIESEKVGVLQTLRENINNVVEKGIETNEELVFAHHISKGFGKFINDGLSEEDYLAIEKCTKLIIAYVIRNHSSISSDLLYPRFAFRQPTPRKIVSDLETKAEFLNRSIHLLKVLERYDASTIRQVENAGDVVKACLLNKKASEEHSKGNYELACETLKEVIALVPPEQELESLYRQWCDIRELFRKNSSLVR